RRMRLGSEGPRTLVRAVGHRDLLRSLDVRAARPVARLAIHVDARPRGRIRIAGRLVALLEARRMACGAARIPVERRGAPVQRVPGTYVLVRIKIEPTLPAFGSRPRAPPQRPRLPAGAAAVHGRSLR